MMVRFDFATCAEHLALLAIAVLICSGCSCSGEVMDSLFARMKDQPSFRHYERDRFPETQTVIGSTVPGTIARKRPSDASAALQSSTATGLIRRGRDRYDRFCAPCHGLTGFGNPPVTRMMKTRSPPSLHGSRLRKQSPERVYDIIARGSGLMPGFSAQLLPRDRWAIISYLQTLRISQSMRLSELDKDAQDQAGRQLH